MITPNMLHNGYYRQVLHADGWYVVYEENKDPTSRSYERLIAWVVTDELTDSDGTIQSFIKGVDSDGIDHGYFISRNAYKFLSFEYRPNEVRKYFKVRTTS